MVKCSPHQPRNCAITFAAVRVEHCAGPSKPKGLSITNSGNGLSIALNAPSTHIYIARILHEQITRPTHSSNMTLYDIRRV